MISVLQEDDQKFGRKSKIISDEDDEWFGCQE
jgi:hypothetical protein